MSYSWNTMNRKEVLTHWSPVPSSGALWEGRRISVQYLQWPFPLTGEGPMGKNWRRQTMNNRVQGWAMVPAQHVPLQDVDYRRMRGHSKDQGTSSGPSGPHLWHLLKAKSQVLLAVVYQPLMSLHLIRQSIRHHFSFTLNMGPQLNIQLRATLFISKNNNHPLKRPSHIWFPPYFQLFRSYK